MMKVIEKKTTEVDKFIKDAIDKVKGNKDIVDCILIPIFEDTSSTLFHTSMRYSEMVFVLEAQKLGIHESLSNEE